MEENINETQQENNNADSLNTADNSNKEEIAENNKPDYREFTVSLSSIDYEGPLSILFDMLKRSEKNIYEVSILEIIDQFVEYLKAQAALNLDSTGDFLVVASEFHLYKSKMLLPHDMDDDKFTDRLKFEIVEQMLEFQRYKMVSEELDRLQDVSDSIFERKDTERVKFFQNIESIEDNEVAWKDITLYDLVYAFTKVQFVPETDLAVLSGMSNFHIDNAIDMIRIKLSESAFFPFIVLFKDGVTKRQLVTFFLAMLELVKEKEILLKQEMRFKEIYVFKRDETLMPKSEETAKEENNDNTEEVSNNAEVNENTEYNSSEENDENVSNNENSDNQS
ncbi:segregation/condensation protein A [Brachyspira alvinipulli]|uniref:segregation and condensation protein A n=1 Tax=Brachyspira alvinipulli TaxID=84379 RepID=UPI003006B414